ncbi:MAG: putative bifunctional diguanylate cyclase/phosphodiesterase [Gammaproteobacteria bacterium]
MKLQAKILLALLPLVVVPLALLATITAKELEQAREHAIAARLLGPIEAVASRFHWLLRGVRGDLTALARLHDDAAESGPQTLYSEIQRSFRITQQTRAGYLDLMLIGEKGKVQVRSRQEPERKRYTSQPAIAAMLRHEADEFSMLIPVDSKKTRALWISKRIAVNDRNRPVASRSPGYFVVVVSLNSLSEIEVDESLSAFSQLLITDWSGHALLQVPQSSGAILGVFEAPDLRRIASRRQTINLKEQGQTWWFAGRQLHTELFAFFGLPATAVASPLPAFAPRAMLLGLASIAVFIGLGSMVLRAFLTRPVQALKQATEQLGKGNQPVAIDVRSKDELGEIAELISNVGRDLKQSGEKIRYFAYHDSLTRLPNRRMFSEYLKHALAHARRREQSLALLFLDLDDFKRVNDTLGHQAGDVVLRELSERLLNCVRADDYVGRQFPNPAEGQTVARLGGDEFTILLPSISLPIEASTVAERVIKAVETPFVHGNTELHVGASIGITIYPNDGMDADTLIKNADMAMYHAKELGKNTYQFYREAMNVAAVKRHVLENALRKAIERNELQLVYQPQMELKSGRIVAAEALLRWHHPHDGLIGPERFIPLAEETGLIVSIGEWIIHTACRQAGAWRAAGHHGLTVAINVSGAQFIRQDLVGLLQSALNKSGLPPEAVEIELTETSILRAEQSIFKTLPALKELGIQVALDDFGTGYSSLSYLRQLPVDKLKIDTSFIRHITVDPKDAAIVSAILAMAENLKIPVVAEGVETNAQIEFLRRRNCSYVQGYIISRPVSGDVLPSMLAQSAVRA